MFVGHSYAKITFIPLYPHRAFYCHCVGHPQLSPGPRRHLKNDTVDTYEKLVLGDNMSHWENGCLLKTLYISIFSSDWWSSNRGGNQYSQLEPRQPCIILTPGVTSKILNQDCRAHYQPGLATDLSACSLLLTLQAQGGYEVASGLASIFLCPPSGRCYSSCSLLWVLEDTNPAQTPWLGSRPHNS